MLDRISTIKNLKVLALAETGHVRQALTELRAHRADLLKFALKAPKSDTESGAGQRSLPEDTAFVYFCVQPLQDEPTLVFVECVIEGQKQTHFIKLPRLTHAHLDWWIRRNTDDPQKSWLGAYAAFKHSKQLNTFLAGMDVVLEALSERITPLFDVLIQLPEHIRHLVVYPSGAFSVMPLSALFLNQADNVRLIDRFSVEYATGCKPREVAAQPGLQNSIIVSDPRYNLKGAGLETRAIAELCKAPTVLHGEAASREDVVSSVSNLTSTAHIHLVTHGRYSWRHPEISELELAGTDVLSLQSIYLDIEVPEGSIVTLSACEAGLNEYESLPEEAYGLPVSFLIAGANRVVSALWPVSDFATTKLMVRYYQGLKDGASVQDALRMAQLDLRSAGEDVTSVLDENGVEVRWGAHQRDTVSGYKSETGELHPFFWAGFVVWS